MFSIVYCESRKTQLNNHKFGNFFFFFEFAKNEGRSDPCPNTLIWSGLIDFYKKLVSFESIKETDHSLQTTIKMQNTPHILI